MANRWGNNGNSDRLYFLGSKITADGICSHEIKRPLLLRRKVMTKVQTTGILITLDGRKAMSLRNGTRCQWITEKGRVWKLQMISMFSVKEGEMSLLRMGDLKVGLKEGGNSCKSCCGRRSWRGSGHAHRRTAGWFRKSSWDWRPGTCKDNTENFCNFSRATLPILIWDLRNLLVGV